jgi:signal transduction histidine kinase
MSIQSALQSIPFFDSFNPAQLDEMVHLGTAVRLTAGATLFRQGDPAESLYVILKGSVKIIGRDPEGHPIELSTLIKGQFFGELALVDGGTRSATVETLEDSEFFILERPNFIRILSASPELLSLVLASISSKIKSSNEKIYLEMLEHQRIQAEMEIERHRSLAEMVAGVAHEINTPLGIVNVSASMITEYLTPELLARVSDPELCALLGDIQEAAQLMQRNIARANRLIQSFKSISVNQITDQLETGNLCEWIQEIIDLFKIKARQAHLKLELKADADAAELNWTGYPGYLSQILMNLFSNVERYAYSAGGTIEIRLSLLKRADQNFFQLCVQDFGKGIPAEDLTRVFDVFFTTGRHKGGTGLGMSIVHNLVTSALKGTIALESEPGQGTTVVLEFPQIISSLISEPRT